MKKNLLFFLSITMLLCSIFFAWSAPPSARAADLPKDIIMSTHPIGAITYVIATAWADIVSKNTPMRMSVKPQAGPGVYLPQLNSGRLDMGVDLCTGLSRAWNGEEEFKGRRLGNLRSLWLNRVQKNGTVAAVRRSSPFYEITDLKGAKVASDYGANVNVVRYFTVAFAGAGMSWDDVVKVPVPSHIGGLRALHEGRVDSTFMMGLGVPHVQEIHASVPLRMIGYPKNPAEIPEFEQLLPGMEPVLIKQSQYPEYLPKDTWGHSQPFWYLTSTHLSMDAAYHLVKTAWDYCEKIRPSHPQMKAFNQQLMPAIQWAPYHEGAVKFYKEKGVWTDQLEAKQKKLLGS